MGNKKGSLTVWHITMLALGTIVGGSFFLGSSIALKAAGPSILISYILGGVLVYIILKALSEMSVAYQVEGSFRTYAEQLYGPLLGFVVGWVYWTGLILAMSSEATAASVFLRSWFPKLSLSLTAAFIIIGVTLLNLLGAKLLTTIESGLAVIKLSAIIGFILLAVSLFLGILPHVSPIGLNTLTAEPFFPGGISGIAGSMLIVMFTYAGFEIIGLAATDAKNPTYTIPRAIIFTVIALVSLYILAILFLLPLIPTNQLSENISPFVAGLNAVGMGWASNAMNIILLLAILSTMLAAMFGLGRMVHSLAQEGYAPAWLKENRDVPMRGIIFSGISMLIGVGLANILPQQIYLFLVSSGGFSLLFTYVVIMITQYKFRRVHGCQPNGKCQLRGYPISSILGFIALIAIIISMPLIPGQGAGLFAGVILLFFYLITFIIIRSYALIKSKKKITINNLSLFQLKENRLGLKNNLYPQVEFSKELTEKKKVKSKGEEK